MLSKLRSLGPPLSSVSLRESLRAGLGGMIIVAIVGLLALATSNEPSLGFYMIAPFGATAVLVFAVPNSPLAQPWSAIVGNSVAALIGVAVCLAVPDPTFRNALAVGLAIMATSLCRALHPPAGAVALTASMNPEAVTNLGWQFIITPVAAGTIFIVLAGVLYARITGRHYPLRQFEATNRHGTSELSPVERVGLSEQDLTRILERYRQSFNLGVQDLARLIGAVELETAARRAGPMTAADIMSQNLITVSPDTSLGQVADLFRHHKFTSLPVVGEHNRFLGVIFQMHLIARAREDALQLDRKFISSMKSLLSRSQNMKSLQAKDIMSTTTPKILPTTPIAALLPLMADGDVDAIPVLEGEQIVGIVTQTDLISALARSSLP